MAARYALDHSPEPVFVINLARRPDRWEKLTQQWTTKTKLFQPLRFEALEGTPGWRFLALGFLALLKKAYQEQLPYLIVSEDDTEIIDEHFDERWLQIRYFLRHYPQQWDIFNGNPSYCEWGGNSVCRLWPSPLLCQYGYGKTTNFMIFNHTIYARLLQLYPLYAQPCPPSEYEQLAIDHRFCVSQGKLITSLPFLTRQATGFSDLENRVVSYQAILARSENHLQCTLGVDYVSPRLVGGLGNQMFILATAFALARQQRTSLRLVRHNYHPCEHRAVNDYWETFFAALPTAAASPVDDSHEQEVLRESQEFIYQPLQRQRKQTVLQGYFQSIKYFHDYRQDLRNLFQAPEEVLKVLKRHYPLLFVPNPWRRLAAVHVRRGDYVLKSHYHHLVPLEYYQRGWHQINSSLTPPPQSPAENATMQSPTQPPQPQPQSQPLLIVAIFSDDIPWCRQHLAPTIPINMHPLFIEEVPDYQQLWLLQYGVFDYYLLANSTFAWWGAYLNDNPHKQVFLPSRWLEDGRYPEELLLPGWSKINY